MTTYIVYDSEAKVVISDVTVAQCNQLCTKLSAKGWNCTGWYLNPIGGQFGEEWKWNGFQFIKE